MDPPRVLDLRILLFLIILSQISPVVALLCDASSTNLTGTAFDYIIVGCGISGLVLASRLTEQANTTVLCLEAGGLYVNELTLSTLGLIFSKGSKRRLDSIPLLHWIATTLCLPLVSHLHPAASTRWPDSTDAHGKRRRRRELD
jgi:choline dehydrogenase-like flavoprotein